VGGHGPPTEAARDDGKNRIRTLALAWLNTQNFKDTGLFRVSLEVRISNAGWIDVNPLIICREERMGATPGLAEEFGDALLQVRQCCRGCHVTTRSSYIRKPKRSVLNCKVSKVARRERPRHFYGLRLSARLQGLRRWWRAQRRRNLRPDRRPEPGACIPSGTC
jgi:hypothetical protein